MYSFLKFVCRADNKYIRWLENTQNDGTKKLTYPIRIEMGIIK